MKIDPKLIESARQAIIQAEIVKNEEYDKVFKGYISSFGASIAQAGLLPTIIFFENKSDQAESRPKVIAALKKMLSQDFPKDSSLAQLIIDKQLTEDNKFMKTIVDSMVAMKMALRMYKEKSNDNM